MFEKEKDSAPAESTGGATPDLWSSTPQSFPAEPPTTDGPLWPAPVSAPLTPTGTVSSPPEGDVPPYSTPASSSIFAAPPESVSANADSVTIRMPAAPVPESGFAEPSGPLGAPRWLGDPAPTAVMSALPSAALSSSPVAPPLQRSAAQPNRGSDSKPARSRRSRLGRWMMAGMVGVVLVAVGFAVGSALSNDEPGTAAQAGVDVPAAAQLDPVPVEVESAAPAPAAPAIAAGEEPIVAVARVVSPSVVRIDDGFGGLGSGIVYSTDGYIVTNAHVVGDNVSLLITFADGVRIEGTVIGTDPETDIAVVQVEPTAPLIAAAFADPASIEVGQMAIAIGSPFGLSQSVTAGIVSSARRPVDAQQNPELNTVVPMIQTDAPINPGNSGGALVDREGRIVGMNTLIRTDPTSDVIGNIGVGFAIPSDIIQLVANGIIAGDPVAPSVLGVTGSDPEIGEQPGAVIQDVTPDTAAALAGILSGDRIVVFDGVHIGSMRDLAAVVRLSQATDPIEVQLVRDAVPVTVQVLLQPR